MTGRLGVRHAALGVSDLPRALAFYVETLGFEPAYISDTDWAMVGMAGTTLSLIPVPGYAPPRIQGGSHPAHLGIVLASQADVDDLHRRLQFTDVPSIEPPKVHRDGSYGFYLTDPDGNPLECIFIPYRLQGAAHPEPSDEAVILLAAGEAAPQGMAPYQELAERLRRHAPDVPVGLAFTAGVQPGLADVARQLAAHGGISRLRVVPVTFAADGRSGQDMAALVTAAQRDCPEVAMTLAAPIGAHPQVQEAMVSVIAESLETPSRP